jgi:hypothetical protein
MATLFIVVGVFLLSGTVVTLVMSRIVGLRMTFGRFLAALASAIAVSVAFASALIAILAKTSCGADKPCEYGGLFEGGLLVLGLWLVCYSLTYLIAAFFVARLQLRAHRPVENDA